MYVTKSFLHVFLKILPCEFKGRKPSLKHIKMWDCPAYVKTMETRKLDNGSKRCRFRRYPKETYDYKFYYVDNKKLIVNKYAQFKISL